MTAVATAKGSWWQRFAIYTLSILLGLLVYWLIGFFLDDIGNIPGPQYDAYIKQVNQSTVKKQADKLDNQINQLQTQIANLEQQQSLLKNALNNSQNSINQILQIQKLNAEKGQVVNNELNSTFQQNTQLFVSQQNKLQQMNDQGTELSLKLQEYKASRDTVGKQVDKLTQQAQKQYDAATNIHQMQLGLLQIGLLLVLLAIVIFLLFNKSASYSRIIWTAIGIAILVKVFFVVHYYFPSRYFKYILTISLICVVFVALRDLLKRRAYPAASYLLKQFRDAYEHFLCPKCEYPIRRGPMRYAFWTRRTLKKLVFAQYHTEEQDPYHCPHCGTSLYKSCENCQQMRQSLMPYCEHCGTEYSLK